jgi:fumarylacetoacetase
VVQSGISKSIRARKQNKTSSRCTRSRCPHISPPSCSCEPSPLTYIGLVNLEIADMAQKSWLPIPSDSHFSLANIPFGIISTASSNTPRPAIAIGEHALDLAAFTAKGGFDTLPPIQNHLTVFSEPTLNPFAALGHPTHRAVREYLQKIFADDTPHPAILKSNEPLKKEALIPLKDVRNHLPMAIGDYTDFFAGINHAVNVGTMFRGAANALQPNYLNLPVAYHGRSSSVVVSGTSIRRPRGQILLNPAAEPKVPTFTMSKRLDIELELGFFVCKESNMGHPIDVNEAEDSIFGAVLVNDWSARDLQVWEYIPLGPFNAKNFGTSISPWVVLADALAPFMCKGIENKTELQKYLQEDRKENVYNIHLEVDLTSKAPRIYVLKRCILRGKSPC